MMTAKSLLPATWAVPKAFRERLGEQVGRQRTMLADGHLLLVLHAPPSADRTTREGRFFWRAPDGSWTSDAIGSGIGALHKHLDRYEEALQKLEQAEDRAEYARDFFPILESVAALSRTAGNMHQALQAAREAVPDDRDLLVCRDRAYAIHRQAELLQTDTRHALDCAVARRAEEEAASSQAMLRAAFRLNVLAAMFFPIVTISAIFGMNLEHGLRGPSETMLFWMLVVAGVLGGLILKALLIERPDIPTRQGKAR
jgi:tetratricopeptide (TPR) repeat protein